MRSEGARDLRIIYEVHEDQQVVRVVALDRRGKIY